ncbi:Uncharacterised protein [Mycobacteroides abscessus subsp. abscessus]|nr:Uncharacterised protein [Mycobacteroides abscessus subsp. abscessus]
MLLGPADVHTHQHLRPIGRVDAARTRPDVDHGVARVVLAGEHGLDFHSLDVAAQGFALGVGVGKRRRARLTLFGLREFVVDGHVIESLPQFGDTTQLRLGVREFACHLLRVVLVVPQIRVGRLHLELVDPPTQLLDVEDFLDGRQGRVEGFEIGCYVRMHGLPGYRLLIADVPPLLTPTAVPRAARRVSAWEAIGRNSTSSRSCPVCRRRHARIRSAATVRPR